MQAHAAWIEKIPTQNCEATFQYVITTNFMAISQRNSEVSMGQMLADERNVS
jgi:hypothetical protein